MNLLNAIAVGLKEIAAHKVRSLLTMFGIVLGVSSLVAMAAIVKGMENGMTESLVAMGGLDKVLIQDEDVPVYQQHLEDQATGRTIKDVEALRASAPLIKLVSPEMELDDAVLTRGGRTHIPSEVIGAWPEVLEMNLYEIEHGRFFTPLDEERAHSVCVIGTGIRDELFGTPQQTGKPVVPIGEVININEQPFTIVGMFKHYESEQTRKRREQEARMGPAVTNGPARQRGWGRRNWDAFWRKNNVVYTPLNTMWVKFRSASGTNGTPDPRLSDIDIKVADIRQLEPALQQARNVLMLTHNGIEDFEFRTQENQVEDINRRIRNARISGGIIAALSLIIGGIGIMNIMLASINERIREIGTCKAIGATGLDIFIQILVESVTVALMGALAGLGASWLLVHLISVLSPSQNSPVMTAAPMILAIVFSALVGVLSGLIPAFKAARLDPIQALRYE